VRGLPLFVKVSHSGSSFSLFSFFLPFSGGRRSFKEGLSFFLPGWDNGPLLSGQTPPRYTMTDSPPGKGSSPSLLGSQMVYPFTSFPLLSNPLFRTKWFPFLGVFPWRADSPFLRDPTHASFLSFSKFWCLTGRDCRWGFSLSQVESVARASNFFPWLCGHYHFFFRLLFVFACTPSLDKHLRNYLSLDRVSRSSPFCQAGAYAFLFPPCKVFLPALSTPVFFFPPPEKRIPFFPVIVACPFPFFYDHGSSRGPPLGV